MKRKTKFCFHSLVRSLTFLGIFVFCLAGKSYSQTSDSAVPESKPRIVIYDVMTGSYDRGKARLLSDLFRSEIFKTQMFDIIEKGIVQEVSGSKLVDMDDAGLMAIGRSAEAAKLLICSVEKFDQTIAISVRIVDVASALIDYSDNFFLSDENLIFEAIKESASKIEFYYASGSKNSDIAPETDLRMRWSMLKAEGEDLAYLVASRIDTDEYLTIRQYDITFTPTQYAAIVDSHNNLPESAKKITR